MGFLRSLSILGFMFLAMTGTAAVAQDVSAVKSAQTIERKIYKRINALPYYGVFDQIGFTIDGSTVTLTGRVAEIRNRKDAENAIRDVEGVGTVVNKIEVLPLSTFDDNIRRNALRTISRSGGSLYRYLLEPSPSMRIIVSGGHLTLEGNVSGKGDSDLAYVLARTIPGVFSVTNNLTIGKSN